MSIVVDRFVDFYNALPASKAIQDSYEIQARSRRPGTQQLLGAINVQVVSLTRSLGVINVQIISSTGW